MLIRDLGCVDYLPTYVAMQSFTQARTPETLDELWLCQHTPVLTQGVAGKSEHLLVSSAVPVVQSNRGGQMTYHGPGQVVAYPLLNLHRLNIFVKEYVYRMEAAVLATLALYGVTGHRISGAPGIYVRLDQPFAHAILSKRVLSDGITLDFEGLGKIAALGVKVSKGCAYHGVSLNVAMDLSPFQTINPCGYAGLVTVDMASLGVPVDCATVAQQLSEQLVARFRPALP
jgi:lipoyl(octanoyl) transferase